MTEKALLTQSELLRIAKTAKATGCRVEIKHQGMTITIIPDADAAPTDDAGPGNGIDYSRPVF